MTSDLPPAPDESLWRAAVQQAWRETTAPDQGHPDVEALAAYAEGSLPDAERSSCEDHLGRCPACLELVRSLGGSRGEGAAGPASTGRPRRRRLLWLAPAACVLFGVAGVFWGLVQRRAAQDQQREVAALEDRLAGARTQLAAAHKEAFLALAPSGVRVYWNGATSARTLQLSVTRGSAKPSPEALAHAEQARQAFQELAGQPGHRGQALLELASLDVAAGRLEQAGGRLREAQEVLGDTPALTNVRAVWYMARGDRPSARQAEAILRELTQEHPDYLPGWYNLALLLQQTFRDDESRKVWQEYLRHERRPEYRRAAQEHLASFLPEEG